MAIPTPSCSDGPNELLRKILLGLPEISGGGLPVEIDDEGVPLTLSVESINFVGDCVSATASGNDVTVTITCSGDVFGPGIAVNGNLASFNGVTGKLIADSGISTASVITSTKLQAATQAIGNGVDTISVVFPTPFASVPVIVITIKKPVADSIIDANVDSASVTVNGFTASLGGSTTSANYGLSWIATI